MIINIDLLLLVVACIFNLCVITLFLTQAYQKIYMKHFIGLVALLIVWVISNYYAANYFGNLEIPHIGSVIAYVSGYLMFLAGLLFTYYFPIRREITYGEIIPIALLSGVTIVLSFTPLIAPPPELIDGRIVYGRGDFLVLYLLAITAVSCVAVRNLLQLPPRSTPQEKSHGRIVLTVFIISAALGILVNIVLPLMKPEWDVVRLGPLVSIIFVSGVTYAIAKRGLFDIKLTTIRTTAYLLSLTTLAGVYFLAAYMISILTIGGHGSALATYAPINIVVAFILTIIFQPIKRFFDKATDSIFYRSQYDRNDFLIRVGKVLSSTTDLDRLMENVLKDIETTLKASYVLAFVYTDDHHYDMFGKSRETFDDDLLEEMTTHVGFSKDEPVDVAEFAGGNTEFHMRLVERNVSVVVPLTRLGGPLGFLVLGEKQSGFYTRHDIGTLAAIADEIMIAIQNSLSLAKVQDLNANLEQKVQSATRELRRSNKKLLELDATKDEFISMASHQLRTPLTSIKGYLSMVLEGDVGKITASQRKLLTEAFVSSERMVHLIGDFLNVSRLQTGRFMLEIHKVDFAKVVTQEVESMRAIAATHGVVINYRKPAVSPTIYVDEGKLRQVMMNFIDNAIYYAPDTQTIEVRLDVADGQVVFEVVDRGMGVPKDVQKQLFTKFFRADNARRQRPDGTGIGLYLAKKIVDAHGGQIIFRSTEGKGSVFGFRLPIKKLSSPPEDDPEDLEQQNRQRDDDRGSD